MLIYYSIAIWLIIGCLCGAMTVLFWADKKKWSKRVQKINFFVMVPFGPIGVPIMIIRAVLGS